jgi:hypothetical protein
MKKKTAVMSKHDKLVEAAKEAISEVFSDKSVERADTKESLMTLIDEIHIMLDAL